MATLLFTGATGFIGGEALTQALANPAVKQVISLQRRELPNATSNPKLRQVLLKTDEQWTDYPELKAELAVVDGVVWALGVLPNKSKGEAHTKRVCLDYTTYAITQLLRARPAGAAPLRFTYVSGSGVVRDQKASLWVMGSFRKLRGLTENALLETQESEGADKFVTSIARPSGVVRRGLPALEVSGITIGVEKLGAAVVDLALEGQTGPVSNKELIQLGEKVLKAKGAEK